MTFTLQLTYSRENSAFYLLFYLTHRRHKNSQKIWILSASRLGIKKGPLPVFRTEVWCHDVFILGHSIPSWNGTKAYRNPFLFREEVQGHSPGSGHSPAQIQARQRRAWVQLWGEGFGSNLVLKVSFNPNHSIKKFLKGM